MAYDCPRTSCAGTMEESDPVEEGILICSVDQLKVAEADLASGKAYTWYV